MIEENEENEVDSNRRRRVDEEFIEALLELPPDNALRVAEERRNIMVLVMVLFQAKNKKKIF